MKIFLIHGQNHIGTTARIGRAVAKKLGGEVKEFFLPRDFHEFCVGCGNCFNISEEKCPHYSKIKDITKAMDEADILIFTSPVYVYHVTAPMKAFLDHFGYQWMIHRPKPSYFTKQAVLISTAAGAGTKSTLKDMEDSMFFWGVGKIYKMGFNVHALTFNHVSSDTKKMMSKKINEVVREIKSNQGKITGMSLKQKALFEVMRKLQKAGKFSETDNEYWKEQGWI